ncbi:MAG TPA: TIR domain-containing protein, partial [Pseudonocardiaceae bacterium]
MGGVFINYRTIDDPLGAASIHERLVFRFGRANVFRDCESLPPGAHYPSTIRQALANAAVLVAVIGPRWLTLTDETAVRLIDREHDWVRGELELAFTSGIPVLPVLLKDTPANATMPMFDELPEKIRPLAAIQAFEISQRRWADDLERLIAAIARIGPMSAAAAPTALPPA